MSRRGMSQVLWIIVVGVVLLLLAVLLMGASGQTMNDWLGWSDSSIDEGQRKDCEDSVSYFCSRNEDGTDWSTHHPGCEDYRDVIDAQSDTQCPLD